MTTTVDRAALAAELAAGGDGRAVELPNGRSLRLKIEPDPDDTDPFDDSDCHGKVAPLSRGNDYSRSGERPSGFNGAAEKIRTRGDTFWWQPPADVKRTDPGFAALRRVVVELAEYGQQGVTVELCRGRDAYGRPIVVDVASLWGVEPFPSTDYLEEIIGDLLDEIAFRSEEITLQASA